MNAAFESYCLWSVLPASRFCPWQLQAGADAACAVPDGKHFEYTVTNAIIATTR